MLGLRRTDFGFRLLAPCGQELPDIVSIAHDEQAQSNQLWVRNHSHSSFDSQGLTSLLQQIRLKLRVELGFPRPFLRGSLATCLLSCITGAG